MWHASVAKLNQSWKPVFCRSIATKKLAYRIGESLLADVGIGETFMKQGEYAFHVRRSLSQEEIVLLPSAWLALPAVDMAG